MQEAMKVDIVELNKAEAFGALMAISVKKSRKMPRLKLRCRVICRGITL